MSPTILDKPEVRFPLRLGIENKRIRELFHNATRQQWNPATDIAWNDLHPEQYRGDQLQAARMYWSRRAWGEYGAISESPAFTGCRAFFSPARAWGRVSYPAFLHFLDPGHAVRLVQPCEYPGSTV